MIVSMTVGIVWYAVIRIQMLLREKNVQLETARAAETTVVRQREQERPVPARSSRTSCPSPSRN